MGYIACERELSSLSSNYGHFLRSQFGRVGRAANKYEYGGELKYKVVAYYWKVDMRT